MFSLSILCLQAEHLCEILCKQASLSRCPIRSWNSMNNIISRKSALQAINVILLPLEKSSQVFYSRPSGLARYVGYLSPAITVLEVLAYSENHACPIVVSYVLGSRFSIDFMLIFLPVGGINSVPTSRVAFM